MKTPRFFAGVSLSLAFAFLSSACTTVPTRTVQVEPTRTYAIVAADDQGVLSQVDFQKVKIGIVQFLTDEGFVQSGDQFITDLLRADVVFRVRIAWRGAAGGFSVTDVAPSYSGNPDAPAYVAEPSPADAPWYYDPWYYDPWYNNNYFGQYYGSYDPFMGLYPFLPIYAWDQFRSPRVIKRPPIKGEPHGNHPGPPNGYTRYSPRPDGNDHWTPRMPGTQPRRPPGDNDSRRDDRSNWRNRNADPNHPSPDSNRWRQPSPSGNNRAPTPDNSKWQRSRPASGDRVAPRTSRPTPAPNHYSPSAREHSAPSTPSYSAPAPSYSAPAPSYSAPAPSSPPPSSDNSNGGSRSSRTLER